MLNLTISRVDRLVFGVVLLQFRLHFDLFYVIFDDILGDLDTKTTCITHILAHNTGHF